MKIGVDPEQWSGTGVFILENGRGQGPEGSSDEDAS